MSSKIHILVEQGKDAGKEFSIPPEGARIGRSSKNDIVLIDPLLSRHHCRLFFKDDGLWITDLGSANETLIDDKPVIETAIHLNQKITIGDTVIRVVDDGRPVSGTSPVDLGLHGSNSAPSKRIGFGPLITVLCVVIAITGGIYLFKTLNHKPAPEITTAKPVIDRSLSVDYEKTEASADNIFYYHLSITPDRTLSITIDDLENNRSVRDSKKVDESLIEGLTDTIAESGFFNLNPLYEGVDPTSLNQRTISITIGKDTHQTRVINRADPDLFSIVREKLEDFGQVEMGLWAIQFSTEKLLSMSSDAYHLGKKLYAERQVALGNLAAAITAFKEAQWYLQTVEEKPDFYADILDSCADCKNDLNNRYKEQNFVAERAMQLRDWESAAKELRVLLELIPSREDKRNIEARKKLIEVEAQLEALK